MVGGVTDRQLRRAAVRHRAVRFAVRPPASTDNGIRPLETDGLMGIVFAPLLHSNWDHLIANTDPGVDPRLPDDARGSVAVHLRHGHRLDPRRLRHVADRQRRYALPVRRRELRDQPHRRIGPDLRLAGVPDRVRILHPHDLGDRRRRRRAVRLRRRPARCASRHAGGLVAGPLVRGDRGRDRRLSAVRSRAEGSRSPQGRHRSCRATARELALGAGRDLRFRRRRTDRRAGDHRPAARRGHHLRR